MAKKISLQLEIGGVKQNVSSINDLEKAIKGAKQQLAGLDIGSKEFEKLSGEIRKAQNFAEDLNETLKPQQLEKRVGAYAKVGSAIVSSFAAAQSAIALFGNESEDVAKAAAKAQSILTIALTAREIAEGAVALKTVAANIATLASARAAQAATTATRILWATLAANPLTALVVAIGAAVSAIIYFTSTSEEQKSVLEEVNLQLSEEGNNLRQTQILLTQVGELRSVQRNEIEKLKKTYPGFNALLNQENILTEQGRKFLEAKAQAADIYGNIQKIQSKILEEQNALEDKTNTNRLESQLRIETLQKQITIYYNQLEKLNPIIDAGNTAMEKQAQIDQEAKERKQELIKKQKELTDQYREARKKTIDLSSSVKDLTDDLSEYDSVLGKLQKLEFDSTSIEETKKVLDERRRLLESEIPLLQKINNEIQSVSKVSVDPILENFRDFRSELETLFLNVLEGKNTIQDFDNIFTNFISKNKELTQSQVEVVDGFTQGWKNLTNFFVQNPTLKNIAIDLKNLDVAWDDNLSNLENTDKVYKQVLNFLGEVSAETGNFKKEFDDLSGVLVDFKFDPQKTRKNVEVIFKTIQDKLFDPIARRFAETRKLELIDEREVKRKLGESTIIVDEELKKIEKLLSEKQLTPNLFDKKQIVTINQGIDLVVSKFKELLGVQDQVEGKYLGFVQQAQNLNKELGNNATQISKSTGKIIFNNINDILKNILGLRTKTEQEEEDIREKAKKDIVGLELFKLKLQNEGYAETVKNNEDLLDSYVEYLKKRNLAQEEADDDLERKRVEKLDNISSYIDDFTNTLFSIEDLVSQSFQNQLQALDNTVQAQLALVVGTSESAAKKRLEIEEQYQEQRKQIEKKATLSSLKFQLVQALASSAQAILSILAQPPTVPFVLKAIQTGIAATLGAAQLSIINEQINMANMMRRGGLVKAQGGMLLSGPSHERGGIPIAQMGVVAEGQEAIMSRNSVINFRDLLSTINQSGGGRPLVVNTFDDSRIVEAIAEQKQKPLRAYVLQSEITNEQALSKRLDDLSKI